jgi:hydroxymethylpyrimidine kinase/phosphomethylpyrimidine kinase
MKANARPKVLTIAGSDPTCGAGIQADIRVIYLLGAHPFSCVTSITSQNSSKVDDIFPVPAELIRGQLEVILNEIIPDAVKIGMLYSKEAVAVVKEMIVEFHLRNIVLDPIFVSSTGKKLVTEEAYEEMLLSLVPLVDVITPNRYEAINLFKIFRSSTVDIEELEGVEHIGKALNSLGPSVVITGGDEDGTDILFQKEGTFTLPGTLILSKNTHGTGCVFSSVLATCLAFGFELRAALLYAKRYVRNGIINGYKIGKGQGVLGLT